VRIRNAFVLLFIAVFATSAGSVTGQEEPLPAVTPRALLSAEFPTIALPVEPIRAVEQPTLEEAARRNDFATFDALYREALSRGEPVAQFATLHELWTWAINDPVGAFYGPAMRDRLARAYPGFAAYIEDFRIIDDRGNAFYPTSETRAFLLDRALAGRAPRVLVAEAPSPAVEPAAPVAVRPSPSPRVTKTAAAAPARVAPRRVRAAQPEVPVVAAAAPAPAPVQAAAPPVEVPVASVVETPAVAAPKVDAATPAPSAAVVAPSQAAPQETPVRQNSRGILLLVMGLVGIGLLAVMMRTPREAQPMSIIQPPAPEKPAAPVEPLRRPTPAPPAAPAATDQTRKTGS
jgi:hypothetical protein